MASSRRAGGVLVAAALSIAAPAARADGAFADSKQLFLPADQPQRIVLTTNFGLLVTTDGAATWRWICEPAVAPGLVFTYQMGAAPSYTLFALAGDGLYASRDDACTFRRATGIDGISPTDVFPDPLDASRVLLLGYGQSPVDGGATPSSLFASSDGGRSFGAPLYTAPGGGSLDGVEIARSNPKTVYLTMFSYDQDRAFLARSDDGAATFTLFDASAAVGSDKLLIAAVDPEDDRKVYLRSTGKKGDALVIADQGGASLMVALRLAVQMSAFLRRADGTLLVGSAGGGGYRSSDGGKSFQTWAAPHLRALAERGGRLYAVGDNFSDRFAVGVSDDGQRFTPLFRYDQTCGPATCAPVENACAPSWPAEVSLLAIAPPPACGPQPPQPMPAPDAGAIPSAPSGCSCRLAAHPSARCWPALLPLAIAGRRRRRRAQRRASGAS